MAQSKAKKEAFHIGGIKMLPPVSDDEKIVFQYALDLVLCAKTLLEKRNLRVNKDWDFYTANAYGFASEDYMETIIKMVQLGNQWTNPTYESLKSECLRATLYSSELSELFRHIPLISGDLNQEVNQLLDKNKEFYGDYGSLNVMFCTDGTIGFYAEPFFLELSDFFSEMLDFKDELLMLLQKIEGSVDQ